MLKLGTRASRTPEVAHSTDTSQDLNGVAFTLSNAATLAQRQEKDNTIITCHSGTTVSGEKAFQPLEVYSLPDYPALKLALPPASGILDHYYQQDYPHIQAAAPGPTGLMELLTAKLLQRPFITSCHTEFPEYVGRLTGKFAWRSWRGRTRHLSDKLLVPRFFPRFKFGSTLRQLVCLPTLRPQEILQ